MTDPARGHGPTKVDEYLRNHEGSAGRYEGFNLLLFDLSDAQNPQVGYLTNRPTPTRIDLSPSPMIPPPSGEHEVVETHGLSNTPLRDPFVKVTDGRKKMGQVLKSWTDNHENEHELLERMMDLVS